MKKIILSSLLSLASISSVHASIDFCEGSQDPISYQCREKGPFDVTESTFNSGLSAETSPFNSGYDFEVYVSDHFYQFMQGMERYAEEMEEWIEYTEFKQDQAQAQSLNEDLSDDLAYAVLERMEMKVEYDGVIKWYKHGDIINGTDWDNDGIIDVFEVMSGVNYSDATIR